MNILDEIFRALFKLLEETIRFLFELGEMLITGIPRKNKGYKADFTPAWNILSSRQAGFCLTGRKNLSVKDSYQNALVIGGTGTGKSSIVLIPSLYTMTSSFIVHDPSGELYSKSAGYLQEKGYEVKVLHFANPAVSCGYNPLIRACSASDVQKVASLLVENALGGKGKDPFWNTQAVSLLALLITILKKQEPQFQNLFNVRQLLNALGGNPEAVDALFSKHADDILFAEYKSFIAYDEKVVNGVIATCKAALQIFSDESVTKVTCYDNIDFQEFRDKKVALFIQNSVADQRYYSVLTSIFFEQFFSYALSRFPKEGEQDIFLLIDEASSLNLPTLPLAVANVRKHRSGIMLLLQDFSQLVHLYGNFNAGAIKSNCFAKMYFTGQSLETTKELEQTLGRFEYEEDEGKKVVRPLMTNDEIRTMDASRALLICGNNRPVIAKLKPYYKSRLYRQYSNIPVPEIQNQVHLEPSVLSLSVSTVTDEKES